LPQLQSVKNKHDLRHIRRKKNMQALYAHTFGSSKPQTKDLPKILTNLSKIDKTIQKNAPKWPLDKINKVDLSVLRISLWELLYQPLTPPKVVIDEAVELAKEFGTQSSPSFVNGVLGSAVKKLKIIPSNKNDRPNTGIAKKTGRKIQRS